MDRIFTYEIQEEEQEMELLSFLRSRGFSRHILTAMKADKQAICLNGERGFGHRLLKKGDHLSIRLLETEASPHILPKHLPVSILYEDEDLPICPFIPPRGITKTPWQMQWLIITLPRERPLSFAASTDWTGTPPAP